MLDGGHKRMNIDERIEALTQSVELLAAMHKDNEKSMVEMREAIKHLATEHVRLGEIVNQIGLATENLIMIAHDHETRVTALEG
jgi:hypothetical protein